MIGRSMTVSPLVLSPSSILLVALVSLPFLYRKEKFGLSVKNVINY